MPCVAAVLVLPCASCDMAWPWRRWPWASCLESPMPCGRWRCQFGGWVGWDGMVGRLVEVVLRFVLRLFFLEGHGGENVGLLTCLLFVKIGRHKMNFDKADLKLQFLAGCEGISFYSPIFLLGVKDIREALFFFIFTPKLLKLKGQLRSRNSRVMYPKRVFPPIQVGRYSNLNSVKLRLPLIFDSTQSVAPSGCKILLTWLKSYYEITIEPPKKLG